MQHGILCWILERTKNINGKAGDEIKSVVWLTNAKCIVLLFLLTELWLHKMLTLGESTG